MYNKKLISGVKMPAPRQKNWSGHTMNFNARANETNVRKVLNAPGGEGRTQMKSASAFTREKRLTGIPNRMPYMTKKVPVAPSM